MNCGNCRQTHPSVQDVRNCYDGHHDVPTAPREASREGAAATTKQLDYIKSLLETRPDFELGCTLEHVNRPEASVLIDRLLAHKPTPQEKADVVYTSRVGDGTYTIVHDDGWTTLRLRPATFAKDLPEGSQVAEYLCGQDNTHDYRGFAFIVNGKLRVWKRHNPDARIVSSLRTLLEGRITETAHTQFLDLAEEYALKSGKCMRCFRKLTVPASLYRGLGPVCARAEGVNSGYVPAHVESLFDEDAEVAV